jgi:hypothetical protein
VLEVPASLSTNAGVSFVGGLFPTDFFKVVTLTDDTDPKNSRDMTYMDYREFRRDISNRALPGKPEIYTVNAPKLVSVWPVPTTTINWSLVYEKEPAELIGDTATPTELATRFHWVIVFRAAAIALMAENEEERAETAMQEYATGMDRIVNAYSKRQTGRFTTVLDSQGYGDE